MSAMNIFLLVGFILVVGINGGYYLYEHFQFKKTSKYKDEFDAARKDVAKEFHQKEQEAIIDQERRVREEVSKITYKLEEKQKRLQSELEDVQAQISAAKERRDEQLRSTAAELAKEIEAKSKEGALQLQGVIDYYEQQKRNIVEEFNDFTYDIQNKRTVLQEQLRKAQARQLEIIEEYKRAEKIKQDKDYYRICLTEDAQNDVKKLRKVADELHDPSTLYKLIYKNYYERPFNEMIGRVVSGRGSIGIYKITNLENGRTYIGQTRQAFKERWRTHLKRGVKAEPGTQNKLYAAMWQDGAENFTWEVLAECDATELNEKEKEFIALYHADTWGYNGNKGVD